MAVCRRHPSTHSWKIMHQMPARKKEFEKMGKILKERGFTFVDSTSAFAFMQVAGMVKDHLDT
ncbi:MAG: DNA-3-methyladenine glycosylase I [candidate division NC10 bacterium]|nr:DNA-3-methyladenine glycosylase I [candidate division NC10 bacterium]